MDRVCEVRRKWQRGRKRERKIERDGPPHHPLHQCLSALPGWLIVELGVPLLLAPGPAPGLMCSHLVGEAPALPGPLLLPHPVRPDLCTPLLAPPPRLPAFCPPGLPHLGSSAGRPPTLLVHLPQVSVNIGGTDVFYYDWFLLSSYIINETIGNGYIQTVLLLVSPNLDQTSHTAKLWHAPVEKTQLTRSDLFQ